MTFRLLHTRVFGFDIAVAGFLDTLLAKSTLFAPDIG